MNTKLANLPLACALALTLFGSSSRGQNNFREDLPLKP